MIHDCSYYMEIIPGIPHRERRGLRLPVVGLGTGGLSGQRGMETIMGALETGFRYLVADEAAGDESLPGKAIEASFLDRRDLFIAVRMKEKSFSSEILRESLEKSTEKINSEYVDLAFFQPPPSEAEMEAFMDGILELIEQKKVRYFGFSELPVQAMDHMLEFSSLVGCEVPFNPCHRQDEVLTMARQEDLFVFAREPFDSGNSLLEHPAIRNTANQLHKKPSQVILRWLIEQSHVVVTPDPHSPQPVQEYLDIFDFSLSPKDIETISSIPFDS